MAQPQKPVEMVDVIADRAFRHPKYRMAGKELVIEEMTVVYPDEVITTDRDSALEIVANLKGHIVKEGAEGEAQLAAAKKRRADREKTAREAEAAAKAAAAAADPVARMREEMLAILPAAIAEGVKQGLAAAGKPA